MPINKIDSIDVNGVTYDLEDASAVKAITVNNITHMPLSGDVDLGDLQEELVSGTNIKTINNNSILGSGNLEVGGGGTVVYDGDSTADTPYDNLFAITVASGVDAVSVGLDMDLLWHNASPTSSLSGISVQDDLSDYKWFMFEVCPNYSESSYRNAIQYNFVRIGQDTTLWSTNTLATTAQMNAYWMTRSVSATTSGITVGGGYSKKVSDTSAPVSNNNVCTVMNIYGIRGVINDLTGD